MTPRLHPEMLEALGDLDHLGTGESGGHPLNDLGRGPRPLQFIRVRLHRGGQAEFIKSLLEDEQAALMEELGELRGKNIPDEDPRIQEVTDKLRWLIRAKADIEQGMIELAGPGGF